MIVSEMRSRKLIRSRLLCLGSTLERLKITWRSGVVHPFDVTGDLGLEKLFF